jgi:hypothetical protein
MFSPALKSDASWRVKMVRSAGETRRGNSPPEAGAAATAAALAPGEIAAAAP